jgi:cellulose synthase/poly-beta-1,6-N-acetylglucosamine synthase-like glycosyltransferase
MSPVVGTLLLGASVALLVPSTVFFLECLSALLPFREAPDEETKSHRLVVLVPAHDEQAVIAATLGDIRSELAPGDTLLVVADNCHDDTARIARSLGAHVVERTDPNHRGKGFALDFGIAHMSADPPDVLVVIDADCRVEPGAIRRLARFAMVHRRPAQADNLLTLPQGAAPLTSISALAFLVRNRVRPTGLRRMGLPCQLMGCGMALPWEVVRAAPSAGSHLVEDMMMGIELASRGYAPVYCTGAHVTSPPPKRVRAMRGQRRRWEYGHLSTLIERAPKLIVRGIVRGRLHLLVMGLDLLVPPLALLAMLLSGLLVLSSVWARAGGSSAPVSVAVGALALMALGVVVAWLKFGRQVLPARHLLALPFYILWKVPLYLSFLIRRRHGGWERTERVDTMS